MNKFVSVSSAVTLFLALAAPARAIELQIYYTAIQRLMAEQVFTQEGRLYVRGGAGKNKCDFAYLEHPAIGSSGGRLTIQTRFSGRTARNFFGACVGLGDSFDMKIGAVPYYRDGSIALREVVVESPGRDSYYIRRVRAAVTQSLAKQFKYAVAADAKRVLEQKRDPLYNQELRRFEVTSIQVAADSLIVGLDFQIAVK